MAKGAEAKAYAVTKIKEAFGDAFVCEFDKKLYVNCPEAGGIVQVAISMTCPKVPIGGEVAFRDGGMDFENMSPVVPAAATTELTPVEMENIARLKSILGE